MAKEYKEIEYVEDWDEDWDEDSEEELGPEENCYKDVTERDLLRGNGELLLWMLGKGLFEKLPKTAITQKVLLHPTEEPGKKVIHALAESSEFSDIPKEVLTHKLLKTRPPWGGSVYHILGYNNLLHLLPKELLTKEALLLADQVGTTPLHYLVKTNPSTLPEWVTEDHLLIKNIEDQTPLHFCASGPYWDLIPKEVINTRILMAKTTDGKTVLGGLLASYADSNKHREYLKYGISAEIIQLAISKLTKNELVKIKEQYVDDERITKIVNMELYSRKIGKKLKASKDEIPIEV